MESDWELQKTQCELKVAGGNVLEAQYFALSKSEEARLCRQQLEDVGKLLDLAREKVTAIEAAIAEAAV